MRVFYLLSLSYVYRLYNSSSEKLFDYNMISCNDIGHYHFIYDNAIRLACKDMSEKSWTVVIANATMG